MAYRFFSILLLFSAIVFSSCTRLTTKEQETLFPAEPLIRVLVVEQAEAVQAIASGPFSAEGIQIARDAEFSVLPAGEGLELTMNGEVLESGTVIRLESPDSQSQLRIKDVPFGRGWWWEGTEERTYDNAIEFRGRNGAIDVVVELPVEQYLRGVVPAEIGTSAPLEAMKAQAAAARSETVLALRKGSYRGAGYDICSTVSCQVYGGVNRWNDRTDQAIAETRGVVISYAGEPIHAYYSSNSGGYTESIEHVWRTRDLGIPCWSAVSDTPGIDFLDLSDEETLVQWVKDSPAAYANREAYSGLPQWVQKNFRWSREFTAEEVSEFAAKQKDIGRVLAIETGERGDAGTLLSMRLVGERGELTVGPQLAIRRFFSPPLRSAKMIVTAIGDDRRPSSFRIEGAGYGHGVGMCQTGAMGRALAGQDFAEILTHYYTGAELMQAW